MNAGLISRVGSILGDQGETVTYSRLTGYTRNETTLQNVPTYSSQTITAHFKNYSSDELGGFITENDRQCRVAADAIDFIPEVTDTVTLTASGKKYTVNRVDRRTIGGADAMYILNVRGGSSG